MNEYKPPKHYVPVPNALLEDDSLSMAAKVMYCILAYLLSIPTFVVCRGALRKYCKKGNSAIAAALSELRKRGYLHQYRRRIGKKWQWSYILYAFPFGDGSIITTTNLPKNTYRAPTRGYTKISVSALLRNDISNTVKVVYFYLASKATNENFVFRPYGTATALCCDEKTVQRSIHKLISVGLVSATQSRDEGGKMGAMYYTVYSPIDDASEGASAGGTPAGGTPAGGTPAGGTPAGGTKTTFSNQTEINKTDSIQKDFNQFFSMNPDEIEELCEWCQDRYNNSDLQHIYDITVQCIKRLFMGNTEVQNAMASHLAHKASALSAIAEQVTEVCYERIYYHSEDAAPVSNHSGYITQVVKDYILNWDDKERIRHEMLDNEEATS